MNNIIAHIVGLDEIHKQKLIKKLPKSIKIIDIDIINQQIYNSESLIKLKTDWSKLANAIVNTKKQKHVIGINIVNSKNNDSEYMDMIRKKNEIKKKIHNTWKCQLSNNMHNQINVHNNERIIIIGFNIFPKDYRLKVNIPMKFAQINISGTRHINKIIYGTNPQKYASNQIKYYLKIYYNQIIMGCFPLNLLKLQYLMEKYKKFTTFYYGQGYQFVDSIDLCNVLTNLNSHLTDSIKLTDKPVYVATLYKTGDIIPVNRDKPLKGFLNKTDAINNMRIKIDKPTPIYVYTITNNQFSYVNNEFIAYNQLNPASEESLLLTCD